MYSIKKKLFKLEFDGFQLEFDCKNKRKEESL